MVENTSNTNNTEHTITVEQTNLPAEIDSSNSNKIKFHHLAPEKAENFDLYSDAYDNAFKDEQITNIAVTGPYASGKSSIIQACKEQYGEEKFITLSLTNFTQENNNDKKEIEENLEAQLVNQLIHKIDKSKIQESKFLISHKVDSDIEIIKNKIHKNNKLILLLITSIVILSFNGDMFANTINLIEKYFSKYINIIFSIFEAVKLIAIFIIAGIVIKFFPSILYKIISLIKKNKFRRINLYGNEIELFNNEDNSIFDKHTDEILYLFENAGVKYFIFEDIDRYEDVTVFKKLREINILLNDKRKREKKPLIKFIYLICDNMFTAEERTKIEETGHVVIGSKDISFSDGLTEASYTITSSLDEVNFNKIITEGDIAIEKPGFTSYAIEGISASKEGEDVTSGSVAGKSGNLEIVGDINDATFKYTLTNFMQGDEIFYCKIDIDGEDHYKEIKVIQGDVVTYEEDFAGIVYSNGAAVWVDDYNENYTNGKAKKTDTSEYAAKINFTYIGRGCEVISRIGETGWLQIVGENGTYYIDTGEGLENEMFQVDVTKDIFDNLDYGTHDIQITQAKVSPIMSRYPNFYIDAIKIYK